MLMLIDVGNTNIVFGIHDKKRIITALLFEKRNQTT